MTLFSAIILSAGLVFSSFTAQSTADVHIKNEVSVVSEQPRLIAHAGGAVYGLRYTNSLEALDWSYSLGHRYIELDFRYTTDGEIVCMHDWDSMGERMFGESGQKSEEEFLNEKVLSDLTVMDIDILSDWMSEHTDVYIITDVKEIDNVTFLSKVYERLGDNAKRVIPQAYTPIEYSSLISLGFENVILTSYGSGLTLEELEVFAIENKPWGLTLMREQMDKEFLGRLKKAGINTYCHTVNELWEYETWHEWGLYGIYSDYFTPIGFPVD